MSNAAKVIIDEVAESDDILGDEIVDFTLRYSGPLPTPSGDSRAKVKEGIRKYLSPQLKELWETNPGLTGALVHAQGRRLEIRGNCLYDPSPTVISMRFGYLPFSGWKFIPLVVRSFRWICELDITFLRRHDPGDIVQGGDLDNRMKIFFDGLRIPQGSTEVLSAAEEGQDERCFCLLEDDSLISDVSIKTGRLYGPLGAQSRESDVEIMMHVRVKKLNRDLGH